MANWIIGAIIVIVVVFAVRTLWKNHKNGTCAGGCEGCHGCSHDNSKKISLSQKH